MVDRANSVHKSIAIRRAMTLMLACFFLADAALGSSFLMRSPHASAPRVASIATFGGTATEGHGSNVAAYFTRARVDPERALTVVWALDTFDATTIGKAREDLLSLFEELHRAPTGDRHSRSLRLATLRGAAISISAPFASRGDVENAIASASASMADKPASQAGMPEWLDTVNQHAAELGSRWAPVLLVGSLPALEPYTQSYAQALLARTFSTAQLRVFMMLPDGAPDWSPLFNASGGAALRDMNQLLPAIDETAQDFQIVSWSPPPPPTGFAVASSVVSDAQAQAIATVPDITTAGFALPSIAEEDRFELQIAQADKLLHENPETVDGMRQARDLLGAGQKMNPADPQLLRTEMLYCEQAQAFTEAVKAASLLTRIQPRDAAAWALLAHAQVLAVDWDQAQASLDRAVALKSPESSLAEDYARVYLAKKDTQKAIGYLEQAVHSDQGRADLWLLQAKAEDELNQPALTVQSLEACLKANPGNAEATAWLLRIYVGRDEENKAKALAADALDNLPHDFEIRSRFAQQLVEAHLSQEANAEWERLLSFEPPDADSCVLVAQEMVKAGDSTVAFRLVGIGIEKFPKATQLYMMRSEALLRQGSEYEARAALEAGYAATADVAILSRLAALEESSPDRAEASYAKLASLWKRGDAERVRALQSGLRISLRDGELAQAQSFEAELEGESQAAFTGESRRKPVVDKADGAYTMIPGGLDALAMTAHMRSGVDAERFFSQYARTLAAHLCVSSCPTNSYRDQIEAYFSGLSRLESMGKRDGNRVVITLSVDGEEERRHTDAVLGMLGLELRTVKNKLKAQHILRAGGADRPDLISALNFDEVSLNEALQASKPFAFEIVDQPAAVAGGVEAWAAAFPLSDNNNFALLLASSPRAVRMYVGISSLDRKTLKVLLTATSLKQLSDGSAEMLAMYGSSFAVGSSAEGSAFGHAVVPGGVKAEGLWQQLTGSSPAEPASFFLTLLQPSNSGLLAYFATLSQMDAEHQSFFTANPARASNFAMRLTEMQGAIQGPMHGPDKLHSILTNSSAVGDLLRAVPLEKSKDDEQLHVLFPGSARVWTMLKSNGAEDIGTVPAGSPQRTAPDSEDAILLALAKERLPGYSGGETRLSAYLAVAQVYAHRTATLDERSALLLARQYQEFSSLYPYFMDIRAIDFAGFQSMFGALERIRKLPVLERNLALGQLNALIELDAVLVQRHRISDERAAHIFAAICDRLQAASSGPQRAVASLALAHELIRGCLAEDREANMDKALTVCLVGDLPVATNEYRDVLEGLGAPSLESLRTIVNGAESLMKPEPANGTDASAKAPGAGVTAMIAAIDKLPAINVPREAEDGALEHESMMLYDAGPVKKLAAALAKASAMPNPDARVLSRLAAQILDSLEPQVTVALAGPVYARFLRSTDLVVSEDPLLLRKHRYFDFGSIAGQNQTIVPSQFISTNESAGSYMEGGFAEFELAAAQAAAMPIRQGGSGGKAVVADEIAAIRGADWDLLTEADQRLAALRILAARQWIVESADNPSERSSLAEATVGVLSLSRRAQLLNATIEADWPSAWTAVTLPDLFTLGGSPLLPVTGGTSLTNSNQAPGMRDSVMRELQALKAANGGRGLDILARLPFQIEGCYHPHRVADAPYEEYERRVSEDDLAARSAELKLYLAYRADSLGISPLQLGSVAEAVAVRALQSSQMNDYHDWRSLLAAYAAISNQDVAQAVARLAANN